MRKTRKSHKSHKSHKYSSTSGKNNIYRRRVNFSRKKKIHRNIKRMTTGGALIGQGNYGCVFRPDLTTTTNPATVSNKNVVSKVVLKNNAFSEYRHEYKILKKMRDIDKQGLFHSLLIDAFDLEDQHIPPEFTQCSLTKPSYTTNEFFVFNIAYSGDHDLTYYLKNAFSKTKDTQMIPEPSVLFSILTNIVVGIKKMIAANILHKTLDTDSIFLIEPVTLANAHSAKIIDYGDGELRKYKGYSDKNYDYISFFKSMVDILSSILKDRQHNPIYDKVIQDLIVGFKNLLAMVNQDNVSYNDVIKNYILLLQTVFGIKYSKYAESTYTRSS